MLKEKQKGGGGIGAEWKILDPGCAPAGASHGSRWGRLSLNGGSRGMRVPGWERAVAGAPDRSHRAVATPEGTQPCSGKTIPSTVWEGCDQCLTYPGVNL